MNHNCAFFRPGIFVYAWYENKISYSILFSIIIDVSILVHRVGIVRLTIDVWSNRLLALKCTLVALAISPNELFAVFQEKWRLCSACSALMANLFVMKLTVCA